MEQTLHDQVEQICRQILAPLVAADGGEMYLGPVTADAVAIHLSGSCAGCPGTSLTTEKVIEPIIRSTLPRAHITVTSGWIIPPGWVKLT